jgi:chromatin structure-remodeling complex subunit RSC4
VKKEYARMTGQADEDGEGSDDEGKKKDKQHNFTRLCKTRLQKLVEKTDDK